MIWANWQPAGTSRNFRKNKSADRMTVESRQSWRRKEVGA